MTRPRPYAGRALWHVRRQGGVAAILSRARVARDWLSGVTRHASNARTPAMPDKPTRKLPDKCSCQRSGEPPPGLFRRQKQRQFRATCNASRRIACNVITYHQFHPFRQKPLRRHDVPRPRLFSGGRGGGASPPHARHHFRSLGHAMSCRFVTDNKTDKTIKTTGGENIRHYPKANACRLGFGAFVFPQPATLTMYDSV